MATGTHAIAAAKQLWLQQRSESRPPDPRTQTAKKVASGLHCLMRRVYVHD
jgi:hypothetical protein